MATATATELELLNPQQTRDAWMAKDADGFDGSAGDLSTSDDDIRRGEDCAGGGWRWRLLKRWSRR